MTREQRLYMIKEIRMQLKMVNSALEANDTLAATLYEGRAVDSFKELTEMLKESEKEATKTYILRLVA
jgi:uncharacterized protein YfkK (UPF0435 family)